MKKPADNFHKIYLIILIGSALALAFPTASGIPALSGGNFIFLESISLVLFSLMSVYVITRILIMKTYWSRPKQKASNIIYIFLITASAILIFLSLTGLIWIRYEVKSLCREAIMTYGGDCVIAAKVLLEDENQSYASRNKAVWALGQLADRRALPVLKKYYTGKIPGKESLYHTLSQYELQKAIKWCEENNITSWLYF